VRKVSHVREISPAGTPRAGDAIHRVTAALQADEARAPFQHRQIGAMAGCLLAGVLIPTEVARDSGMMSPTIPI
jgi:hypothetical protein